MTGGTAAGTGTAPRRRGRPAGTRAGAAAGTRERILAAAREEFSARGYDRTSVRSIGKAAGVDAALVHHYFGTKEQVFAAAIEVSFGPALEIPDALAAGGPDGMGERVARFMLGVWENPVSREPLLAIVRSAVTNERAAAVFRGLVGRKVLARIAGGLDVPDPEFRVQLAAAQLVGIIMLRYVVKVEPIASSAAEDLVAVVAPTLQRYLTAPEVRPGAAVSTGASGEPGPAQGPGPSAEPGRSQGSGPSGEPGPPLDPFPGEGLGEGSGPGSGT